MLTKSGLLFSARFVSFGVHSLSLFKSCQRNTAFAVAVAANTSP